MFGVILMRKEFDEEDEPKKSTRGKKNNQKMKPFLVYQYLMRHLVYNDYVKDLRTYRVDRMKDVKLLGIEREGKEVFNKINLKNYTQRVFSMFGGEQQVITIQFINPLLDTVVDRFGKKGMLYNIVDDRHFSITAPVEISDQFYGWVLGFGKKAKILKPQKVVDGFTEYLDKIRNMYES